MAADEDGGPFERSAAVYHRGRPSYPAAAVQHLLDVLGIGAGDRVVELGAGTGVFTSLLAERSVRVSAVEPSAAMRSQIVASDTVAAYEGTAEDTGLPSGCAGGVIAATAWHWFDARPALAEVRRLLEPGGGLGLIWNDYDESVGWVARFAAISDARRPPSEPSARTGTWARRFADVPGWEPLRSAEFDNPWRTTADGLLRRLRSSSAIARLPQHERQEAERELADLLIAEGFASRDELTLPYRTRVSWSRPLF